MSNADHDFSPTPRAGAEESGRAFLVLSEEFVEIFLGGEIDVAIRDVLDRIVECAVELGGPVIIDSSGVTFADSTLVNMIGAFPDRTALSLRRPDAMITTLLALAGMPLPSSDQERVAHSSGQLRRGSGDPQSRGGRPTLNHISAPKMLKTVRKISQVSRG